MHKHPYTVFKAYEIVLHLKNGDNICFLRVDVGINHD